MRIKKLLIVLFCTSSYSALAQLDSAKYAFVESKIAEVKKQYTPDRRSTVFKISVKDEAGKVKLLGETTDKIAKSKLVEILQKSNIAYVDSIELLPSAKLSDKIYGVANLSVCNNRFDPKQEAEMATQMMLGTPVDVLMKRGGWYLVRTPDGYISWTQSEGVGLMNEAQLKKWQSAEKIIYTEYFGHSYQQANVQSNIVSDLVKGSILKLLSVEKGFYKVEYPDSRVAYIEKNKAIPLTNWLNLLNPTSQNVISTAKTLLGTPYLWGGTSIKGVDCSGFIKTSFFLNGVILPRDASQQVLVGDKVDIFEHDSVSIVKGIKNLQPGDLLFFSGKMNGDLNAKITHVGMYIGNGEFIHSSGMVKINSLDRSAANYAEWQTRTLVAARRVLTQIGSKEITKINEHPFYNLSQR